MLETRFYDWIPTVWYYQNMASYVDWWDSSIFQHYDRLNNRVINLQGVYSRPLDRTGYYTFIAARRLPQTGFYQNAVAVQSTWELLQVRCALERYRIAHGGRLPDDLDALVPTFLSVLPVDLVTGMRPHYDAAAGSLAILDWMETGSPTDFLCHLPPEVEDL